MLENEYDKHTKNKQVKKIIQEYNYQEMKAQKNECYIPDFESIPPDVKDECRLITEEMAYNLI